MPTVCCIPGCKSSSKTVRRSDNISFHSFSVNIEERNAWLQAIQEKCNYEFKRFSRVCSLHFEKSCFEYNGLGRRRNIKTGCVPTIFKCPRGHVKCIPIDGNYDKTIFHSKDIQCPNIIVPKTELKDESIYTKISTPTSLCQIDLGTIECSPEVYKLLMLAKSEINCQREQMRLLREKYKKLQGKVQNQRREPSRKERLNLMLLHYKQKHRYRN